jgi:hypothetical protein
MIVAALVCQIFLSRLELLSAQLDPASERHQSMCTMQRQRGPQLLARRAK